MRLLCNVSDSVHVLLLCRAVHSNEGVSRKACAGAISFSGR